MYTQTAVFQLKRKVKLSSKLFSHTLDQFVIVESFRGTLTDTLATLTNVLSMGRASSTRHICNWPMIFVWNT